MSILLSTFFFILGLLIGSFLNVVIYRLNTRKSLGGRSACMSCRHKLSWHELIPLLSFLWLRGRCRKCKTRISLQYPLVELGTGLVFLFLFLTLRHNAIYVSSVSFAASYLFYASAFSVLIVITVYDMKHKIIPDRLAFILGLLAFAGLFLFESSVWRPHIPGIMDILSGIILAAPFAALWLISSGKWMGLGDAKLLLGLGWLLGLEISLSGVVLAFWIGAGTGILLMIFSRHYKIKSEIPFAPFLCLGAFIAFLFQLSLLYF